MSHFRTLRSSLLALGVALLSACDLGVTEPGALPVAGTITVDASAAISYVEISGDSLRPVAVATPSASSQWALGFFATTITTNGGAAGPGGVQVACVCANATATNAQLQAMTAESEAADFEAVRASDATTAAFASDALSPAIAGWYTGSGAAATVTPGRSWILREGSSSVLLAKLRVVSITGASATAMGTIALEYAVQPSAGAPFGATDTLTVAVGADPVYVDLTTGAVTDAGNWDLRLQGWTIRVNGGVSGGGTVRAVLDTSTPYADITHTYAASAPAQAFRADAYTGTFATQPWYRYNITGTDNQIWPTFNVYLVRQGDALFKVQLVGYYGAGGAPRQITLRYQRLAE